MNDYSAIAIELNQPEEQEKLDEYHMICLAPKQNVNTLADIARRGFQVVWDISRWEMGKGKNVGGKFPAGKRHWENGKNIPTKYRQFWDLN